MLMKLNTGTSKKPLPLMNISGSYHRLSLVISILLAALIILSFPMSSLAQEMDYPVPLKPDNDSTGVKANILVFSWKPFSAGTQVYKLEISKNQDMSNPVYIKEVPGTSYTYNEGKLEYNTTYFWRVKAIQPLGGNPSPPSKFTTEKDTGTPAPTTSSQPSDSFIDYLIQNPLLLVTLVGGILIVALALYIASRPRKKPFVLPSTPGMPPPQFAGRPSPPAPGQFVAPPPPQPGTQQLFGATPQPPPISAASQPAGLVCKQCNTANTPGRKFCSNCGGNLQPATTPPPPSPQSTQAGAPSSTNTCPSCGTANAPGRKFCSNCGSSVATTPVSSPPAVQSSGNACPSCGIVNSPERLFCNNCGSPIGKTQQPAPPQQAHPQQAAHPPVTTVEQFSCPLCGTIINRGSNPCPKCGTEFDWRSS